MSAAELFRTGGDTTVRGYAFESLGLKQGDAVLPTRYYYASSVEVTRWIGDAWGIASGYHDDAGRWHDTPVATAAATTLSAALTPSPPETPPRA